MSELPPLHAAHWAYLTGVLIILLAMAWRANVVGPAMLATFAVAWAWTGQPLRAVSAVFGASWAAAQSLFNIFLIIALMTALLSAMRAVGADVSMVTPLRRVMRSGRVAFVLLAGVTYVISLFFWPTPAISLVGAVLLPAAIEAGLPPLAAAMVLAVAGQGMALSADVVIGVAPGLSARAAGVDPQAVALRAWGLSSLTGGVALAWIYLRTRRHLRRPSAQWLHLWQGRVDEIVEGQIEEEIDESPHPAGNRAPWLVACSVWVVFAALIVLMALPHLLGQQPVLQGAGAGRLLGGSAGLLLMLVTAADGRRQGMRPYLDRIGDHLTEGFVFAFRTMGCVLPVAGFFFIGSADTAGSILDVPPAAPTPGLLFDLVRHAQQYLPDSPWAVALGMLGVGILTGIDGSGFSGLPLTGALAGAVAPGTGLDPAALAALGQMGAVWTGGGTLIAWSSLMVVAGVARVPVLAIVRGLVGPVLLGLLLATVVTVGWR